MCRACAGLIEKRLLENPHVVRVHVDAAKGVAHVDGRAGVASVEELAEVAGACCGGRCPVPLPDAAVSSHHHAHTARLEDGAQAPEAQAAAHAEHAGMADPGHDMCDPRMAAAMEADMRRRFWISLVLVIPVVALLARWRCWFGVDAADAIRHPADWIMLAFATPVALWTSSVFHIGAYYSLRSAC